jgi:TetR/AcrR family transcriptional regulator, mexCD-oprJ operon repressor
MPSTPATGHTGQTPDRDTQARRADARRNIAAILDAALACLARNADASVGDIAQAAGVGRVTLYGHFGSRAELVDAVFARTIERADQALAAIDTTGDPRRALTRLVASTWQIIAQFRALLVAAERELPPERIRAHHDQPMRRVQTLIARGQRDGIFRNDLPASWLVAIFYSLLHTAADEITAGRLSHNDAPQVISATLLAAYTLPGSRADEVS